MQRPESAWDLGEDIAKAIHAPILRSGAEPQGPSAPLDLELLGCCIKLAARAFNTTQMTKLHVGCADVRLAGYVNVDCRTTSATDLVCPAWDISGIPLGTVSEIYSRHMLEHLDPDDASRALTHWHSLLAPDGVLNVIVPDIEFHARQLLGLAQSKFPDQMQHAYAGFWGWRAESRGGNREDAHRWGYTFATLSHELTLAGFHDIRRVCEGKDSAPWHLNVLAVRPRLRPSPVAGA